MGSEPNAATAQRHLPMLATASLMVLSATSGVIRVGWPGAVIPLIVLLLTLPPLLVEKWARIRIPVSLQLQYALLVLAGPYAGGQLGFYGAWGPWDMVVHLYSGFPVSLGVIFALGVTLQRYRLVLPVWVEAVLIIAVKALVAVLWEVGEFFYDQLFDQATQADNFDTMTDMLAGMFPGFLLAAALILHRSKGWFRYVGYLLNVPPGAPAHRTAG